MKIKPQGIPVIWKSYRLIARCQGYRSLWCALIATWKTTRAFIDQRLEGNEDMATWEENMELVKPVWEMLETVWGIVGDQPGWHTLYMLEGYPELRPTDITPEMVADALIKSNIPAWWVKEKLEQWKASVS